MKAITLWQPWASLVACGAKQYETRSWAAPKSLPVGALLAIHAAKRTCNPFDDGLEIDAIRAMVRALFPGQSARDAALRFDTMGKAGGRVIAVTRFEGCYRTQNADRALDMIGDEEAFGDWSPARFAWRLSVVSRIEPGIPVPGRQGVWNWEPPAWLAAQLEQKPEEGSEAR